MDNAPPLEQVVRETRNVAQILLLVLLCGGVLAAAAYSYFGDEKRQFVNACMRNQFAESECVCTFAAYKRLAPPYSDLVKASVHTSSESYRNAVIAVVLRKASQVSLGFRSR